MDNLSLESILESLQTGMEKSASESGSEKDKEEEAKKAAAEEEKAKAEKGGKEKEPAKKDEQEKSAAFKSGSDLVKEIMEKVASTQIKEDKGSEMNKQASEAGKALAESLMEKLAGLGDQNTTNGIVPGFTPNKTQVDLAAQKAEHDRSFQATPGTDGAGNGGTINQIFDAIVADAQAKGVVSYGGQTSSAAAEGAANGQAPNQVQVDESHEKMAAAMSLVNSGVDFDDAVELVKQASDELEMEQEAFVKFAAFQELVDNGVDVDLAAAMVKEAGAMTTVAATAAKKGLGKKVAIAAGAGAAAGGAVAAWKSREKKAALDSLIEQGYNFDEAIAAINQEM